MARYVFRQDYEHERDRLVLLERYSDYISQRALLDSVPLTGSRCADIGAGAGSMVCWLARQVGSRGVVEAIDVDSRHLPKNLPDNVRVIKGDIDRLDVSQRYDAIHCRFLLLHLPNAGLTLNALFRALKPHGTLVVIDSDHSTWEVDSRYPSARRVRSAYLEVARNADWNLALGRELPQMLESAGLKNVTGDGYVQYARGGGNACRFLAASFRSLERELLETGLVNRADLEETIWALNASLEFAMRYVTIWAVRGSRGKS